MTKNIRAIALIILCSLSLHGCNSNSGQTANRPDYEDYIKKFASLKELAEGFEKDAPLSGFEINEYFVRVASVLETLLGERASTEKLTEDAESLNSGESGFGIKITEPVKIGDTYYRFVELNNQFNDSIMGGISPLYIQYWSEDTIGFHQLSECATNSGETTSFVDYRIIQDKYISVIVLKRSDIVSDSEAYNFILYKLSEDGIVNCTPKQNINTENGFWEIAAREFCFHNGEISAGIMLYESGNMDNKDKTAIELNDYGVTVTNTDDAAQAVTLAIIDDEWRIQ